MTLKAILAAAALTIAPITALAECTGGHQQAMTCASGSVYDAETNSCKVVSG